MTIWGALALVMIIGGIANKLGLPLERNLTVDEEVENSGREYKKKFVVLIAGIIVSGVGSVI